MRKLILGLFISIITASCQPDDAEAKGAADSDSCGGMLSSVPNASGSSRTVTPTGTLDPKGAFFTSFGTNGRTCNTCHTADAGWSLTPASLAARFNRTRGKDPIFMLDGLNYPGAPQDTLENRRKSSSLLLTRGLIAIKQPAGATSANGTVRDFRLTAVDNPYPSSDVGLPAQLILFRKPLPTANLFAVTSVNWDGRNTPVDATKPGGVDIFLGLKNQANGATANHAQPTGPLDDVTRQAIVNQELTFYAAQERSNQAGSLGSKGAKGGPDGILNTTFIPETTSPGTTFTLFDAWATLPRRGESRAKAQIAAGQKVFNTKTFGAANGTCAGCHNAPNLGSNSTALKFFNVGVSNVARRLPDVPLYTFERLDGPGGNPTGETLQTTDPGRALISGKWADMGKFKVPSLRDLAARAPYFHDGSAATIADVVNHYEKQFGIVFTGTEEADLIAFLSAL